MTEMSPASHVLPSHTQKSGSIGPLLPNCTAKLLDVSDGSLVTERGKVVFSKISFFIIIQSLRLI